MRRKSQNKKTQKQLRAERALEPVPHPKFEFSDKHHVFIAKLKGGELSALNNLTVKARAAITPLFEMWPPTTPRTPKHKPGLPSPKPKPPKTLTAHASYLLELARAEWNLPFYLDTRYVPAGGIPSPASAKTIFDVARTQSANLIFRDCRNHF